MSLILFSLLMFTGGFIDSIAGGGGLITIPAYMSLNLPTTYVFGTNKLSASMATFSSFLQFLRSHKLHVKLLLKLVPFSFLGSALGVLSFQYIQKNNAEYFNNLIPFLIIGIGIYSIFDKKLGEKDEFIEPDRKTFLKGCFFVLLIGFYDGFFGPGTGTFFILILIKIFHVNFIVASGGTKLLNLTSGLTALFVFLIKGNILFHFGLLGFLFAWIGSIIGSHFAIHKGTKFIKPIFITITFILSTSMILDKYFDITIKNLF